MVDVVIVGASFSGMAALAALGGEAEVFTAERKLGEGTPFALDRPGARILSFNISENILQTTTASLRLAGVISRDTVTSSSSSAASAFSEDMMSFRGTQQHSVPAASLSAPQYTNPAPRPLPTSTTETLRATECCPAVFAIPFAVVGIHMPKQL